MIKAGSINEVIAYLDHIIEWSRQKQSRVGYFATLYRKMTIAVQKGIADKSFEDGKRMELLDVIFANHYLQAWEAYFNKQRCSNSWCATFDSRANNGLIVLQHLLLGINTHINLDLGIAAAQACPGDSIYGLQKDFEKINDVISTLMQGVQDDLTEVWPPLRFFAGIANHRHEPILNFSMDAARKASWANAVALSVATGEAKKNYINRMDNSVVILANRIINPGFAVRFILSPVRAMENDKVSDIIEMLY
ncbi:MAG: hypothetical protein JWQ40_2715 [Segetibacter sp.]|nr:hypothetical protein [Segetibacter sp.]